MIKKTAALFFVFAFCISYIFCNPIEISFFQELKREFESADENTLVIFDVDEVLITTEDQFSHPDADSVCLPLIRRALSRIHTEEGRKNFVDTVSLLTVLPKRILIEKVAPYVIKGLQKRQIKVIALTSCSTGPFGIIPKLERWRIDQLQAFDISFASSFPQMESEFFNELSSDGKSPPLFEEGILFSKGYEKGQVLKAFLDRCHWRPHKVIFIDDLRINHKSVEKEMHALQIPCQCYQYNGAKRIFKEINEALLTHQLEHLLQNKEWLNDAEVEKRIVHSLNP